MNWDSFLRFVVSPYMLQGAWTTIWLTCAAMAIGIVIGALAAMMRLGRNVVLRSVSGFYVWLWRATPLLVQLVIIYTGLPQIGIRLTVVQSALIGFGLNEGAYVAEIIRGGILAIDRGQVDAARALGMDHRRTAQIVVLPQAARIIVPPLGNQFNGMLKTSSLASVITLDELLRHAQQLAQVEFHVMEAYLAATLYYVVLTTLWGTVQRRVESYFDRPYAGAA